MASSDFCVAFPPCFSLDIAAVCRSAGAAFSAAGELFVGPATSGIDFPYLDQAMGAGILDAFGAVSVHP